jgi:hypothetical protein
MGLQGGKEKYRERFLLELAPGEMQFSKAPLSSPGLSWRTEFQNPTQQRDL